MRMMFRLTQFDENLLIFIFKTTSCSAFFRVSPSIAKINKEKEVQRRGKVRIQQESVRQ